MCSIIGGGYCNIVSDSFSSILGGKYNTASCNGATIGGGYCNNASGSYSSILGGQNNYICGYSNSHIIGSNIYADRIDTTFVNNLSIKNIPTSDAGLPSGALWKDGANRLNIVP